MLKFHIPNIADNYTKMDIIEFNGKEYDASHGSAFDRGMSDSYYKKPQNPHMWPSGVFKGERITLEPKTDDYAAYIAGYEYNEQFGGEKDYG